MQKSSHPKDKSSNTAMSTSAIRKKLMTYIAKADEKKVKGMYMLFEDEIESEKAFKLSEEHMKILEEERGKHINGKTNSYRWSQAKQIIRGKGKL